MCELLGMSFNLPVRPNISFRGFRHGGEDNPHGWGIAFYSDESAQVIKEPVKATGSRLARFIQHYQRAKSKIFIGHVRYTSVGSKSRKNTHPFYRELQGKEYVFAHNGTLHEYQDLELGRFKPIGETDSEHAFCHLLYRIEEKNILEWRSWDFDWLADTLQEINAYGTFNCIFSDGEHLFCYYDMKGYNGLCLLHRKPPYEEIELLDEDWRINLAEEKRPEQTGYIIATRKLTNATRKLTNEAWEPLRFGELIVFKDGRIVYSNKRKSAEGATNLTDLEIKILSVLRRSPHRVKLKRICEELKRSADDVKAAIHSLLCKGYIRQDGRDNVSWNSDNATFYTEPSKRGEIDELIK